MSPDDVILALAGLWQLDPKSDWQGQHVDSGRGIKPLDPEEILADREVADFKREDIGYLTKPVAVPKWIGQVQTRYAFLRDLTPDELRWCACNARDRYEVEQILSNLS